MASGPVLELRHAGETVARFTPPPGATLTIGRDPGNPVVIPDPAVSRRHAQLRVLDTPGREVLVRDLGSTNGLRQRGRPVTRALLEPGDSVAIGDYEVVYLAAGDAGGA